MCIRDRSTLCPARKTSQLSAQSGSILVRTRCTWLCLDEKGAIVLREKVSRNRISARLVNVPPCLIGIEVGMATHYMSRELLVLGHEVKQVPPAYARPFRQGHKNDFRDAQAVAEAVQRPSTRCVPIKTDNQQDLQALHRVRSRLIGDRTA